MVIFSTDSTAAPLAHAPECSSCETCKFVILPAKSQRIGLCGFFHEFREATMKETSTTGILRQHHGLRTFQLFRQKL